MSLEESLTDSSAVRRFSGYISLKPQVGNDLSRIYSRTVIGRVWKKWAMAQITQKKPCIRITVGYSQESTISIESTEHKSSKDPVVKVNGKLNSSHENSSDEEVIEMLRSMFCTLAKALKQTQVEFKFYGDDDKYLCRYNISYSKKSHPKSQGRLQSSSLLDEEEPDKTIAQHMQLPVMGPLQQTDALGSGGSSALQSPPKPSPTPRHDGPKEVDVDDLMPWYGEIDIVSQRWSVGPTEVEC
ncbi:expressed unknown protein [Seminavis robusta]|uniref:Uncharacterized protein n=1 Tax=Seminavis robusta TaxID=568900 RepID=A0A9N8HS35_9STRA|nr:expressed unknown protein [Seminavis robusta]|eukprot:Sro1472_g275500.1 n/a (242) ;mRNA; r:13441-14166